LWAAFGRLLSSGPGGEREVLSVLVGVGVGSDLHPHPGDLAGNSSHTHSLEQAALLAAVAGVHPRTRCVSKRTQRNQPA
jgi:hypothetical protein